MKSTKTPVHPVRFEKVFTFACSPGIGPKRPVHGGECGGVGGCKPMNQDESSPNFRGLYPPFLLNLVICCNLLALHVLKTLPYILQIAISCRVCGSPGLLDSTLPAPPRTCPKPGELSAGSWPPIELPLVIIHFDGMFSVKDSPSSFLGGSSI